MSLATEMQDDIAELLDDADIGRDIRIVRSTPGAYSAADGSTATATTATWSTRGLFLNYEDKLIDGTMIRRGDRKCFVKLKDSSYSPKVDDAVTAGSDKYAVLDFETIELGGTSIIFILHVRR